MDENQNDIMNINFGLSEYGRMQYMLKMADLLKLKKRYEILMNESDHKDKREYAKKIDKLQDGAKKILKDMEEYAQKHPSKAVTAFIQFQSNNGRVKMREAFKAGCCARCCDPEKYKHKLIDSEWPEVSRAPDPGVIIW